MKNRQGCGSLRCACTNRVDFSLKFAHPVFLGFSRVAGAPTFLLGRKRVVRFLNTIELCYIWRTAQEQSKIEDYTEERIAEFTREDVALGVLLDRYSIETE